MFKIKTAVFAATMLAGTAVWTLGSILSETDAQQGLVLLVGPGVRDQTAMTRSDAYPTVRNDVPAVQQMAIVPTDALAPLHDGWHPLTGDSSN